AGGSSGGRTVPPSIPANKGMGHRAIGRQLGIHHSTVARALITIGAILIFMGMVLIVVGAFLLIRRLLGRDRTQSHSW
ncbi:helix-turn-helix domain-containing protein, partial [Streptomyces sp. NPDC056159]|uniref:helix-turn-helix domain-containing protein n=1 Tax=Streptomyces sp. NPDC056159 TaxID=3155537 RepID=UPI00344694A6